MVLERGGDGGRGAATLGAEVAARQCTTGTGDAASWHSIEGEQTSCQWMASQQLAGLGAEVPLADVVLQTGASSPLPSFTFPFSPHLSSILNPLPLTRRPCQQALPFMEAVLRASSEQRRNVAVVKGLTRSANLEVRP